MMFKKRVLLLLLTFGCFFLINGQEGQDRVSYSRIDQSLLPNVSEQEASMEGEYYSISLLTAAPGDELTELYFWWGHSAIIVEDLRTSAKRIYDYGVFSMNEESLMLNFMGGRIKYLVGRHSPASYPYVINSFYKEDRWVVLQRLDFEPAATYKVVKYLENNVKPGNNEYNYHFFDQNCCTKIRDLFDFALGGQFYDKLYVPTDLTRRDSARQYLSESFLADWGLNFLLSGNVVDKPATLWSQLYLPYELMNSVEDFSYIDSNGNNRKLVKKNGRTEIIPSKKRKELGSAGLTNGDPGRIRKDNSLGWVFALLAGLGSGSLGALLFLFGTKNKSVRIIGGIYNSIIILSLFVLGTVLFHMALNSDHDVTYYNWNLILINPFTMLTGFILSLLYAANVGKSNRAYSIFWLFMAMGGVVLLVLRLTGIAHQNNDMTLSALLPWFVFMSLSGIFRNRIK